MSETIARDIQRLEQDTVVTMFELDATEHGAGVLRFSTGMVDGAMIRFGGKEFTPLPIQAEGFEWDGQGTLPRPSLTVTAMDMAFLSLVLSAEDLVGAPIRRIRTFRRHLDDGDDPDPDATLPVDHYVIERKSSQTKQRIQFELSVAMDQEGRRVPARQIIRDTCGHQYRRKVGDTYDYSQATCPYSGFEEWDEAGEPSFGNDKCGKRLSDCRLRFGQTAVLPFYGFPGVGKSA